VIWMAEREQSAGQNNIRSELHECAVGGPRHGLEKWILSVVTE
jgi:hypothetical protein